MSTKEGFHCSWYLSVHIVQTLSLYYSFLWLGVCERHKKLSPIFMQCYANIILIIFMCTPEIVL